MALGKGAVSKALIQEPQLPTGSQAPPFALDCVKASWGCAKQPTCYRPHLMAKPTSHIQIEKGSILSTPSVLNHCVKQVPLSSHLLSQPAYFFFGKAKAAAVFAGVINRGTLQLLIWRKTGLQPGSLLRKARTRSHIRLRHIQAPATYSLQQCLAAKHLSLKDDNILASQATAEPCPPSPAAVHVCHCPGFVPTWWMGLRNSTSQTKGFWLYLYPDLVHH